MTRTYSTTTDEKGWSRVHYQIRDKDGTLVGAGMLRDKYGNQAEAQAAADRQTAEGSDMHVIMEMLDLTPQI